MEDKGILLTHHVLVSSRLMGGKLCVISLKNILRFSLAQKLAVNICDSTMALSECCHLQMDVAFS